MKTPLVRSLFAFAVGLVLTSSAFAQAPKLQFPRPSPTATLKQRVGVTDIEITYSRPGVKGRQIFGDAQSLVPFGEVWRTGANEATKVSFSTPVSFGGTAVPAGEYALFSIPGETEWTVILNRVAGQWGAYKYDAANDVARVKVPAMALSHPVETFTIDLNDIRDNAATLNLIWAKTCVAVPLQVDTVGILGPKIEAAMAGDPKPSVAAYDGAAQFYLDNGLDLKKAAAWAAVAVAQKPDAYYLYYHQARVLAKLGDKAGAAAAAHRSLELAEKDTGPAKDEYVRLNQNLLASLGQ